MSKAEEDFPSDVPSALVVEEGIDAFTVRGRCMLFIEMISDVASDLVSPESEHYDETLAWVKDPANLEAWIEVVDASTSVVPILQNAFLERPKELKQACERVTRSIKRNGGDLLHFMEAMGMSSALSESSLTAWESFDDGLPEESMAA